MVGLNFRQVVMLILMWAILLAMINGSAPVLVFFLAMLASFNWVPGWRWK